MRTKQDLDSLLSDTEDEEDGLEAFLERFDLSKEYVWLICCIADIDRILVFQSGFRFHIQPEGRRVISCQEDTLTFRAIPHRCLTSKIWFIHANNS